ncbi:hypothetical protein BH10PLA2_BH10PLA2_22440 [soil metagenome]
MKARGAVISMALASALLNGCVERRYVITTDPPGAVVNQDGRYLGATPADNHFIYYGKKHFEIVKEGYETLQVDQEISTPWYEYPGLDFISETLTPFRIIDRREFHYKLEPRKLPDQAQFIQQAQLLRQKGLELGPGKPSGPPAQSPPPGVLPNVSPPPGVMSTGNMVAPPPGAIINNPPAFGAASIAPPSTEISPSCWHLRHGLVASSGHGSTINTALC